MVLVQSVPFHIPFRFSLPRALKGDNRLSRVMPIPITPNAGERELQDDGATTRFRPSLSLDAMMIVMESAPCHHDSFMEKCPLKLELLELRAQRRISVLCLD